MDKVKSCFDIKSDANMVVTGNPGIGKSYFYLYWIFRLTRQREVAVKKLSSFKLVLNCGGRFHTYDSERKGFIELDETLFIHFGINGMCFGSLTEIRRNLMVGVECLFCLRILDLMD